MKAAMRSLASIRMTVDRVRGMSDDFTTSVRLSAEKHDFHRSEAYRLRALAKTITTKAIKERVLKQAQEHARLIGLLREHDA